MDKDLRTLWCGNLSTRVTEDLLYELFLQAGPLEDVKIPRDRDSRPRAYGFVTFKHDESVEYALELFKGTSLYNRELCIDRKVRPRQPEPQIQQHPQIFLPIANGLMGGIIPNLPYAVPIGYPMPYAFQERMGHHGRNDLYPSQDRRIPPRQHPYRRH